MKGQKSLLFYCAVLLVTVAILTQEVDARRKILRGRKAVTRTYYRDTAIPAWAVVLLVGLGELIAGAIAYVVMKKFIIDPPLTGTYSPTDTIEP